MGSVAFDKIRNVWGFFHIHFDYNTGLNGAFYSPDEEYNGVTKGNIETDNIGVCNTRFEAGRIVPIGAVNRPRSLGVLACAYMGMPAL